MSTVDLANGEGFIYSLEEEDNDLNDNVNNGDMEEGASIVKWTKKVLRYTEAMISS
jgi:hypothetical protein